MKRFFLRPLITEKSMAQSSNSVYQFVVPVWATKNEIGDAISQRFSVTVMSVATSRNQGEVVQFRRRPGQKAMTKKAIVTLKKGDTISSFTLPVETSNTATEANEPQPEVVTPTESTITVRSRSKKGDR